MNKIRYIICVLAIYVNCACVYSQTPVWNITLGNGQYSNGEGVIETDDHGFYILGNTSQSMGNTSVYLARIDSAGNLLWDKMFGDLHVNRATDFKMCPDKGFIITGYTNKDITKGYDCFLMKIDSAGTMQWYKTYGGSDWDFSESVLLLQDSSFVFAGKTFSYGGGLDNIYIVKTTWLGDTLWTRVLGGDSSDYATSLDTAAGDCIWVGANTRSFGAGETDGLVIRMDDNGAVIWTKLYGDVLDDVINSIKQVPDGGLVFAGTTENFGAMNHDNWLMRLDANLVQMWMMPAVWTIGSEDDVVNSVTIDDSSAFVISGYTNGSGMGLRDAAMTIQREWIYYKCSLMIGSVQDDEFVYSVQTKDLGYISVGSTWGLGPGNSNILVTKGDKECIHSFSYPHETGLQEDNLNQYEELPYVYPTISDGTFTIVCGMLESGPTTLRISDITGREVYSHLTEPYWKSFSFSLGSLQQGIYFVILQSSDRQDVFKIILAK